MNTRVTGLSITVGRSAILMGLFACLVYAEPTMALRNLKLGDQIPSFSVKGLDGSILERSDLEGKTAVLLFVRPKHAASLTALKEADRIRRDYDGAPIVLVAVSTSEKGAPYFARMIEEHGLKISIAVDAGRTMYGTYGVIVAPTTLLIDAKGTLKFELSHLPPNYTDRLRLHVALLLGRITLEEHEAALESGKPVVPEAQQQHERRIAMAESLMSQRDFAQARTVLADMKRQGEDARIILLLGICHLEVGAVDEAGKLLESPVLEKAKPRGLLLARARLAAARKQYDQAMLLLQEALTSGEDPAPVLYELGQIHERKNKFQKAAEYYRKAFEHARKRQ